MTDDEKQTKYSGDCVPVETEDATRISDEVISKIAGIELSKIDGVNPVGGGIGDFLGRSNPSRGVRIEGAGDEIKVEVIIVVDYGVHIPQVSQEIQARLREAITNMTGKFVSAVNVNVQGIRTGHEKRETADEEGPEELDKEE